MNRDISLRAHELTESTPNKALRQIRSVENLSSSSAVDNKKELKRSYSSGKIDQLAFESVCQYLNNKGSLLTDSSASSLSADTPNTPFTESSIPEVLPKDDSTKSKGMTDTPEIPQKTAEQIKEQEKQREEIERINKCEGKLSGRQLEEIHRCEIDGRVYTAESLPKLVDVLKEQGLTATEDELAKLKKPNDTCRVQDSKGDDIEARFLSLRETAEKREEEVRAREINVKEITSRIGRPGMCGNGTIGEEFVAFKVSGEKLGDDVNHGKPQLAENPKKIAERVGVPDDDGARENFYNELVANGSAGVGDRTVEILPLDRTVRGLQAEESELRDGINKLAVRDWGKGYEGKEVQLWEKPSSFVAYSVDELVRASGKSKEDIAQIKPGEILKIDNGTIDLTRPTLYDAAKIKTDGHENRKENVARYYESLTGIKIDSSKDVFVYEFKEKLYVAEQPLSVQALEDQGVTITEQELKNGNAEVVALADAQNKLEKNKKEQEQNIENLVKKLGREDLVDIEKLPLNEQEEELQREIKERKQSIEDLAKELGREDLTDIENLPLNKQEKKLQEKVEEINKNIEDLAKELGHEDLTDIENLPLNKQEKKLQEEREAQTERILELAYKLFDKKYGKDQAVVYEVNDVKNPYWTGWGTPEILVEEGLKIVYKDKNIVITDKNIEEMRKGEKTIIVNGEGENVLEVKILNFKDRVEALEKKLKDKYIGEIKKIQNELSGEDSEPVEMDWKQAEKHLEGLKKTQKERIDYIKEIEPDGQAKAIYCEVTVDGKSEILDYQNLEAMKKGLKDQKLVPEENHLDELKKAGSQYSEGDITVRHLPLDEVVEKLPLQRIKDMEAYKIRENLEAGKVYQHSTTNQIHFGDTPATPDYNEVTDKTRKEQIIRDEEKTRLKDFAIYRDEDTGYLYPTTDRDKAKAYFKVNDTDLDAMHLSEIDQKKAAKDIFFQRKYIAECAKEWWGENLKDFDDANNFPPLYKITFDGGPEGGNLYLPSTIKAAFSDTALEQDLANLEPGQSITYGNRVEIDITSLSVSEAWHEMRSRVSEREKVHAIVEEEGRRQLEKKEVGVDEVRVKAYFYDAVPEGVTKLDDKGKEAYIERIIQRRLASTKVYKDRYDRIYAGSPSMAETFFNIKDIDALVGDRDNSLGLKEVPENEWAVVLPKLQEQRQADAQLRASMGEDQIFGYMSISGDKRALAPTRREVAEKLLPAERFSVFSKDVKDIEERLERDVNLRPMTSVEARDWYIEERYKMICDQSGNAGELKGLKSEKGIQRLNDIEKQRTDSIKSAHRFVFGKGIRSENVCGYMVMYKDGTERFYNADNFPALVQDLRDLQKKGSLPLGWKDLDKLTPEKLKVGGKPYKVDTDNKRFKQFGPEIKVRRIGLESTEEEMQKMYINKLYSVIEQNNEPTLKRDPESIKISDSAKREGKIKKLETEARRSVERINALRKDVYNENPDKGAKWEDSCGYLVGNVFYTPKRFQQLASREGMSKTQEEEMSKMLVVGDPASDPASDPSYDYTTKSGVKYEVRRLGLRRTEQELKKSQEKIYRRLEQLLKLPKTDEEYRTYRLVREIADDEGHWRSDYSSIEVTDNKASLESRIKDTHFKDKDVDLNVDLDVRQVGESVQYTSKDGKVRLKVERVAENKACEELDKEEKVHIMEIAELQEDYGSKKPNDMFGGGDVRNWKQILGYRIRLVEKEGKDPYQILQAAESPSKMAERLVARGIKDKDGIAKMKKELSSIYDRNNTAENYEFSVIIEKDGKQIEEKYIVEKVEISEIKAKMEQNITKTKNEIIKNLPLYEQADSWNYDKIYAGKLEDWRHVCFAEVDGKLRFGESIQAIKAEFPGKKYKTDISYYDALQELKKMTKDRGAYITLMKYVYDEQRARIKQAFPEVDFDKEVGGYRFKFLSAEKHLDLEKVNKNGKKQRYIGASLTEAAEFFGVKRKELEKLVALTEVGNDGYFKGSFSGVKRRQVDNDTVEVVLANRDQWKTDPIYKYKDATGKIWFSDEEHLDNLPEFKDKSMVRISKEGINIRNVVNPNPLAMSQIKVDWTDPEKDKKDTPASKDSDNQDIEQPIVSQPISPSLDQWLSDPLPITPLITAEA